MENEIIKKIQNLVKDSVEIAYYEGKKDALDIVKNHLSEYHQTIGKLKKDEGDDVEVNEQYVLALENIIKLLTPPQV